MISCNKVTVKQYRAAGGRFGIDLCIPNDSTKPVYGKLYYYGDDTDCQHSNKVFDGWVTFYDTPWDKKFCEFLDELAKMPGIEMRIYPGLYAGRTVAIKGL